MRVQVPDIEHVWIDMIDQDLERVMKGEPPINQDLAPLSRFVSSIASLREDVPAEDLIRRSTENAVDVVRDLRAPTRSVDEGVGVRAWESLRRRVSASTVALITVFGMGGVAIASNSAAPGDWNYGIDRMVEVIGIGSGGIGERIAEASQTDIVNDETASGDVAAKEQPTTAMVDGRPPFSDNGDKRPKSLLDYIKNADSVDGLIVSQLAREINQVPGVGEGPEERGQGAKPGESTQPGKPESPGKPEGPGKPESPGRSAAPDRPETPGRP